MTTKLAICLAGLGAALLLSGCDGPPPEDLAPSPTPTIVSTAVEEMATPATRFATVVAGQAITSTTVATTPRIAVVPVATPTPGTPTATPTPGPSAGLMREAAAIQQSFQSLREALAAGDGEAVLRAQRGLLEELPKAEAAAGDDLSKAGESFRAALRALKSALNGDLAKLDSVDKGLADVLGALPRGQSTVTATAATGLKPIASLPQFARDLAGAVAAFQKAVDQGNIADMLRLQKALLDELDRGDAALRGSRVKHADLIRGALEDLRNALAGDSVKFDSAEAKLRQAADAAAAEGTVKTVTATATGKQLDVQPLANELHNKLDALSHAIAVKNMDDIAKAQRSLADQVTKTEEALKDDRSTRGAALRQTLGAIREAASGDTTKIAAASSALDRLMGGQ